MESFEKRHLLDPSRYAEERDTESRAAECLETLLPLLREEAERLRKRGFPVDEECRIDPEQFKDVFDERSITPNRTSAEKKEHEWKDEPNKAIGELLETVKTLSFNRHWFNGRLVSLRTAKHDDFVHGVDELILDTQTHQPLAATDTTVSPNFKSKKLLDHVRRGMSLRYGIELTSRFGVMNKTPLEHLPYFIVTIDTPKLLALANELATVGAGPLGDSSESTVLDTLDRQSDLFKKQTSGEIRDHYIKAGELWRKLINRKSP